jgi:hypothetical protein
MMSLRSLVGGLLLMCAPVSSYAADAHETQPDGGIIFERNERGPAEVSAARAQVPVVAVRLPEDRLGRLPRTMRALREGGSLRIVMLGDSIVNDTARSVWHELVEQRYAGSDITRIVSVRGGTGCWWYREDGRIERYVVQQRPDLVIIGGISHRHDIASVRECIRQIRAAMPRVELLLMTGPYGTDVDPLAGEDWRARASGGKNEQYAQALRALAEEHQVAYLDLQLAWGQYLRQLGKPVQTYMRDPVHANALGEAVLGRIMEQFFAPPSDGAGR